MSISLLTLDDLRDVERRQASVLESGTLMERAGQDIASRLERELPPKGRVTILCGTGNNGGDGFTAARCLKARGHDVICVLVGGDEPKAEDAKRAFAAWQAVGGKTVREPDSLGKADIVVDAMLGIGGDRPIHGEILDATIWYNVQNSLKVSIDVPTGLNAETGNWNGRIQGCRSDMTIALLSAHAGLFMNEGRDAAGHVCLSELDVSIPLPLQGLIDEADYGHILEPRPHFCHKGTWGTAAIVGGDDGKIGAAILASRAALRLGAGRVKTEFLASDAPAVDPGCPELMIAESPLDLASFSALVVGPGMGTGEKSVKRLLDAIHCEDTPLVLDADALTILAEKPELQEELLTRRAMTVLTPHPLEAAKLLRNKVEEVQSNRIFWARELALQTGAAIVLKGTGTVVSLRSGHAWVNPTGSAALATAGTGDVLSGMIGSFIAQGYDLTTAVLGAVWLHGAAAQCATMPVLADELSSRAATALGMLRRAKLRWAEAGSDPLSSVGTIALQPGQLAPAPVEMIGKVRH